MTRSLLGLLGLLTPMLVGAPPLHAQTPERVTIAIDETEESTRLVLTHTGEPVHTLQESRGRIVIRYSTPIAVEPAEQRVEGEVLEGYRLRDGDTLIIELGRAYGGYESFELRNPNRLVIDLKSRRARSGGRSARATARELERVIVPDTIIVIDPGHGGIEHGAVGPTGLEEKEVTLALSRALRDSLQRADPSISVVLTRDEDRHLGLDERTAIANNNQADLFVSVHLNASPRATARGAETYYLASQATDDEARKLAVHENRDATAGAAPRTTADLDLVLWDLAQNQHLAVSAALAQSTQRHLNELTGTRDRGVRQAPFRVLMGAMMPAVLVEVGFVSNPEEETKLRSEHYQRQVVQAMTEAIREFLANLERLDGAAKVGKPQVGVP